MSPQELTLMVTAIANGLYECLSEPELTLLAALFNQLGDTLELLLAKAALPGGSCGTGGEGKKSP